MYKFDVWRMYGSPEAQLSADGISIEIVNFLPQVMNDDYCLSHHMLLSWLSPLPVMGQVRFGSHDKYSRYFEFGNLAFIPAAIPVNGRYRLEKEPRRAIAVRYATEGINRLIEDESNCFVPQTMASYNIRDQNIQSGMRLLAKEALNPGFASTILVESIATGLLVQFMRHSRQSDRAHVARGGLAPWQLRRIKERIADQNEGIALPTLTELAALAGISVSHLRRAFKQSTGCTVTVYIREVLLDCARTLLSNTDLTINEIAKQLGFSSQYGFYVAFHRGTGESPSAYRQRKRLRHLI